MLIKFIRNNRIFLLVSLLLLNSFTTDITPEKQIFEAGTAKLLGGATKMAVNVVSGDYLVSLTKPEDGIRFADLPAANKLAIRYASSGVGKLSVAVNNQPMQKLNIHSSGNLSESFLYAIIDISIPSKC